MAQIRMSTPLIISRMRFIINLKMVKRKTFFDVRKLIGIQTRVAKNVPKKAIASVCTKPSKIPGKFQVEKSCHVNIATKIGFILANPARILEREKPKK
jgi:hypothetical protein